MKSKTGKSTQTTQSLKPLSTQEIYKADCEAREWLTRYRKKAKEVGAPQAKAWWEEIITSIERLRGLASANDLRTRMNHAKGK
jgi:hypothetical protein